MNIVFFGSAGPLSTLPLIRLLESGHTICAVAVTKTGNYNQHKDYKTLPIFNENTSSITILAAINQIPVINISANINDSTQEIADFAPDIILVSCFAGKISEQICEQAKLGCFNLHPSLLPAFRGPTPLFWQFKAGLENYGISLHRVTHEWDAGNIVGQKQVKMSPGMNFIQASRALAFAGSELIESSLQQLQSQTLNEITQQKHLISYQHHPTAKDFTVSTQWSATRIVNFICATRHWAIPYPCLINNQIYPLLDIIDYEENAVSTLQIQDNKIRFPCQTGYITALFGNTRSYQN